MNPFLLPPSPPPRDDGAYIDYDARRIDAILEKWTNDPRYTHLDDVRRRHHLPDPCEPPWGGWQGTAEQIQRFRAKLHAAWEKEQRIIRAAETEIYRQAGMTCSDEERAARLATLPRLDDTTTALRDQIAEAEAAIALLFLAHDEPSLLVQCEQNCHRRAIERWTYELALRAAAEPTASTNELSGESP